MKCRAMACRSVGRSSLAAVYKTKAAASQQRPVSTPVTESTNLYARTLITTRRFWARPSRVLFGAAGLSSP